MPKHVIFFALLLTSCAGVAPDFDSGKLTAWNRSIYESPLAKEPFIAHHKRGSYEVFFFASHHTQDPGSATFALLGHFFERFRFDLLLLEHHGSQHAIDTDNREKWIATPGEGARALVTALERKIPVRGGEPDGREIFQKLRASGFGPTEVLGTLFAQMTAWRKRLEKKDHDLRSGADALIRNLCLHLGLPPEECRSFDELSAWYKAETGNAIAAASVEELTPPREKRNRAHEVASAIGKIRDAHFLGVLGEELKARKRIGIVYGHGHYLTQKRSLTDALGEPVRIYRLEDFR